VCAGFTPATASAQPVPSECAAPRNARFFNLGALKGRNLAGQAIARLAPNDPTDLCHDQPRIDHLQAIIQAAAEDAEAELPASPSQAVKCHVLGQIAGLLKRIADLQEQCIDACILDGEFIGEVSAHLYCALSIALDGLGLGDLFTRLATDACGVNFQVACDNKFEEVSTGDPECLPFTEGEFTEVFLQTQNNQCADNPDEP
jgi:hypothetical protein